MGLLSNETRSRCVFFLSAESLISLDHVLKKKDMCNNQQRCISCYEYCCQSFQIDVFLYLRALTIFSVLFPA
jgi:hypothetical protein